jgi:NDP-sugar pyrophosphorylase family protein
MPPTIAAFVDRWPASPFGALTEAAWEVTQRAERHVSRALSKLEGDYEIVGDVAIHRSAIVESGAILKGPAIIGPRCFVAANSYLRGGVFMDEDCIVGPGAELKTSFMFKGSKLAHFNFVGDSILGSDVNLEAGSIVANYRNELSDKAIRIAWEGELIETHVEKFGALLGDGTRIGANAVIAPGAIIAKNARIPRLALFDQSQPGKTV